jgi:hypothetical protein
MLQQLTNPPNHSLLTKVIDWPCCSKGKKSCIMIQWGNGIHKNELFNNNASKHLVHFASCILQSRVWEVVHNVVVVQKHTHGLPNYAKEEPKHHVSHLHRTFRNSRHLKATQYATHPELWTHICKFLS